MARRNETAALTTHDEMPEVLEARREERRAEAGILPAETPIQPCPQFVSTSHIAGIIDRPRPWVQARIDELKIRPAISLDEAEYFQADVLDRVRELSEDFAARNTRARREAAAVERDIS